MSATSPHAESTPHKRVLVTGGRGRVAKAILQDLNEAWQLQACSREAGDGLLAMEELLAGDGPLGFDAIIHCAWSSVPKDVGAQQSHAETPDERLLKRWIARLGRDAEPPLFVFMSTGAVYGNAGEHPSHEDRDDPQPRGEYAAAKLRAERLLLDSSLPVCVLRVAPLYGLPAAAQKGQGVISHLITAAVTGGVFHRWGATSRKDYLHREDFTRALRRIVDGGLKHSALSNGIWNVGSGEATHINDLIRLVEKHSRRRIQIQDSPSPKWDVTDNRLDISKLQHDTGWKASISIDEGIQREVERAR